MISPLQKAFSLRSTCIKRNGLLTVLITPTRVTSENIISRSLDALSTRYENIALLGDFNSCVGDEALQTFCKFYSLDSLIKQPTCFKNPQNSSCIVLNLTNKPRSSDCMFLSCHVRVSE